MTLRRRFFLAAACLATAACSMSTPQPRVSAYGLEGMAMGVKRDQLFPKETKRMAGYYRPGSTVVPPKPIKQPTPHYPAIYKATGTEADVWVGLVVGKDGRVKDAKHLGESRSHFVPVALHAVRGWTFEPGTVNGKAQEFLTTVPIRFRLKDEPEPQPKAKQKPSQQQTRKQG